MIKLQKKLNENSKTVLFLIFLIFLIHQIYYIFIGGTTWDEPASILNGVKQLQKAKLFILDNSNLALQNYSRARILWRVNFYSSRNTNNVFKIY